MMVNGDDAPLMGRAVGMVSLVAEAVRGLGREGAGGGGAHPGGIVYSPEKCVCATSDGRQSPGSWRASDRAES